MKRPALWSALFLILGILLGRYGFGLSVTVLFSIVSVIAAVKFAKVKGLIVLMIFALAGFCLMEGAMNFGTDSLDAYADSGEELVISGRIKDIKETPKGYKRLDVSLDCAKNINGEIVFENEKSVNIMLVTDFRDEIPYSSEIKAYATIEKLLPPENYGEFNSMVYNGAGDFDYTGFAQRVEIVQYKKDFGFYIKSLRDRFLEVYDNILPPNESGILKSVVTGSRSGLSEETKEIYKNAGIFHVLAISGMHISLLAGGVFAFFLNILRLSKRKSALISMGIIAVYAVFTGGNVPVIRALIMFSIAMLGNILGRIQDKFNSLALAGIIILISNPWFLFDAGFLLSFGATVGVLAGLEILSRLEEERRNRLNIALSSIIISLTVLGVILPISIWFFGSISLYSVITNIIVALTFPIIMLLGIVAGVVGMLSLALGSFFAGGTYYLMRLTEIMARMVTLTKYGLLFSGRFSLESTIFYYGGLVFLILIFARKRLPRIIYVFPIVFAVLFSVSLNLNRWIYKNDEIYFLSVGNGDCTVIKTFDNHVFVIDGGGIASKNVGDNTGKNIIMPFLASEGITRIDGILISHLDWDHAMGAVELMGMLPVDGVYIPENLAGEAHIWNKLYSLSVANNIPVYTVSRGDRFDIDETSYIECLSPIRGIGKGDTNRNSMVLKYVKGDFSVLFTGDIDFAAEEVLINSGKDISADVLKVAHHGSKYSTSMDFVNAVGNEISVISVGRNNLYGHPSGEVLERLSRTHIYITHEEGTVKITSRGRGYKVETLKGDIVNEKA